MAKNLFNDLLYIDLISKDDRKEIQFKELIKKIKKEYYTQTPKFEVAFKKPLSNKRIYYTYCIENETKKQLNKFLSSFDIDSSEIHYKYLYSKYYKPFSNYLLEISNYIRENNLTEDQFSKPGQSLKSDEAYILYFLKANAIFLMMELQERFHKYSDENILMQEEIHEVYFSENPPKDIYVHPYQGNPVQIKKETTKSTIFKPLKGDLENRSENSKVLTYSKIIAKPDSFARAEESLFNNSIINHSYNFNNTKGNKLILAAFIHQLISKQIINERIFPGALKIKDRQITKFFALRYGNGSDTNKEFRNFKGLYKSKLIATIQNNYWLDNIN